MFSVNQSFIRYVDLDSCFHFLCSKETVLISSELLLILPMELIPIPTPAHSGSKRFVAKEAKVKEHDQQEGTTLRRRRRTKHKRRLRAKVLKRIDFGIGKVLVLQWGLHSRTRDLRMSTYSLYWLRTRHPLHPWTSQSLMLETTNSPCTITNEGISL